MTVGEDQVWKKIVTVLGSLRGFNAPGLEQVAFSRAQELANLAVTGTEDFNLTLERLMKIGQSDAYKRRQEFIERLEGLQEQTMPTIKQLIADQDDNTESPSFEGGYNSLLKWYRERVAEATTSTED